MKRRRKFCKPLRNIYKFIFLFSFLFPVFSFGQKAVFTPGIVFGLNTSQVSGDELFGFNQFGGYGGLCLNTQINETKSFQFQIAFSQKGSRRPPDQNATQSLYKLRLNYIDVPVFYSHRFQQNKIKQFNAEIGMVNSYLINYSEDNIFGAVVPARPFNKYECSLFLGMGYHLSENIFFAARISNSVLPIRKHLSGGTFYWNRGQYNTVVQFVFHYSIKKKE